MYILLAIGSAFFAGLTTILSKIGIKNINSHLATGIRTSVILVFSWVLVLSLGNSDEMYHLSGRTLLFLALSGMATGGAWLCYFRALQLGNVGPVVAIDKSSTVLTMILAFLLLGESFTVKTALAVALLFIGAMMMAIGPDFFTSKSSKNNLWIIYAIGAAIFSSLTAILGKIGVQSIHSDLATAIRTIFVFICAWGMVFLQKQHYEIAQINKFNWIFLILSGFATGASWLCYYRALQLGPASVVVPIDKLSIVITILFSHFILKEEVHKRSWIGLLFMIIGTLLLL